MEGGDADAETVNAVFRAVHSIKGGAGAFGLDDAGRASPMSSRPRSTSCAPARWRRRDDVLKALLRAADVLADLVARGPRRRRRRRRPQPRRWSPS